MLFRVIGKKEFGVLINILIESIEVIAPRKVGQNVDGQPIHQFLPILDKSQIDLEYETTEYSAKTYFLPFNEKLSTFKYTDNSWEQDIRYRIQPRVMLGLHTCDIAALLKLDKVFAKDFYPNPYYLSRRKNTFTIGISDSPCSSGFCRAVGADTLTHGFDLYLTDLQDRYFVKIGSERGFNLLKQVETLEVTDQDSQDYVEVLNKFEKDYQNIVNLEELPILLDLEFESEDWKKWGDKCLSCGSCSMVCPTCYCYGVQEEVAMDHSASTKVKKLYSCNILDFASVAGDHNFRPNQATRLKYRFYHQHRGFVESFGEPMCVGCNRCGKVCLAGINPVDVIKDLKKDQGTPAKWRVGYER